MLSIVEHSNQMQMTCFILNLISKISSCPQLFQYKNYKFNILQLPGKQNRAEKRHRTGQNRIEQLVSIL